MAAVVGTACAVVIRCGVGEQILAVGALAGVAVAEAVHDISAHTEYLFVSHIEIEAESTRSSDAGTAAETTETSRCAVAETEFVDIVGSPEQRNLVAVPEAVHVEIGLVAVISSVAAFHRPEPAVVHAFFHREVDDGLFLAVVHACKAGKVAFAVHHLQFVDHIDRQIA